MLATLIIVFREMIEAGLIVGIVLAATRGVAYRGRWVSGGVAGGVIGACLVAAFASTISGAMQGIGQEMFNAAVLLAAVIMLAWHNIWMSRHGRQMAADLRSVGEAVTAGQRSLAALAVVVGIAVLREGSEIALFLYGVALSGESSPAAMALGGSLGIGLGAAVSAATFLGLVRVPSKYLFAVTSWLIALLAAGMAAQAFAFLQQAQIVTGLSAVVWNSSGLLAQSSLAGKALHALIGYTDRPTQLQLMAYLVTLLSIFMLMRVCRVRQVRVGA